MGDNTVSTKVTKLQNASLERGHGEDSAETLTTKAAATLLERMKEFRQSYNRTHGQVCEFFEQAHVVEKLYNRPPTSSAPQVRKDVDSDGEEEEEMDSKDDEKDCCNEQKTGAIKKKLNTWRVVMREVVYDVCPNLHLENQPDINPGLMKHVLDEIRKLKTELAFQHNTILELSHQLENHKTKNQKKDLFIAKLLEKSNLIRLSMEQHSNEAEKIEEKLEIDEDFTSIELTDDMEAAGFTSSVLQFGSMKPILDIKSLSPPFSESIANFEKEHLQDNSCASKLAVKQTEFLSIEKKQQEKTINSSSSNRDQDSFFSLDHSSERLTRSCELGLADASVDQKLVSIQSPLSHFESVNKEGTALDSTKTNPRPSIVVVPAPQQSYHCRSGSEEVVEGRRRGLNLRRVPLLGILSQIGCAYMVGKALRRKSRKQ